VALGAQFLDQLAGVDADRAGSWQEPSAAQVSSTSYSYSSSRPCATGEPRLAGDLAAQDDPLARRRGQVAARADRLAEPALDAGRGRLLDRRRRFQVAQMDARVAVEDDPGPRTRRGRRGP
jgi:hypothetical protein